MCPSKRFHIRTAFPPHPPQAVPLPLKGKAEKNGFINFDEAVNVFILIYQNMRIIICETNTTAMSAIGYVAA